MISFKILDLINNIIANKSTFHMFRRGGFLPASVIFRLYSELIK
jgi:hypothetical protein